MTSTEIDWSATRLVIFDVDGTLYDQRSMRLRMLREIAGNALRTRSLRTVQVLRAYRNLRENIADEEIDGFEDVLVARVATANGISKENVKSLVAEWIEQRPLTHILACRYSNINNLFSALKARGKAIGVLSDYPAIAKLTTMGLEADHVVAAGDTGVGIMKPHPRGVELLMKSAGATPAETLVVGDRVERDGLAARRAGAKALIRSNKPLPDWPHFATYSDRIFAPLFDESPR